MFFKKTMKEDNKTVSKIENDEKINTTKKQIKSFKISNG